MSKTLQGVYLFFLLRVVATVSARVPYKIFLDDFEANSNRLKHLAKGLKGANEFHTLNLLHSSGESDCLDYYAFYIKELFIPRLIVKSDLKSSDCHLPNYTLDNANSEIFLFVPDWREFNKTFGSFVKSKLFKNLSKYKIILCHPAITDDYETLRGLAKIVWSEKMLNFVFHFYNNEHYRGVAQYNPFTDDLKVVSLEDALGGFEEYPDKLKDINGYPLRILNYPNYVDDSYLYFDFVYNFEKALRRSLNATLIYENIDLDHSNMQNIFYYVSNTDVDLCLQPQATSRRNIPEAYVDKIDFSYPHLMNDLVVIVPKPKTVKKWTYIISNFMKGSIVLLFLMSFIVAEIDQFLIEGGLDIQYFLLTALKVPCSIQKKTTTRVAWLIFLLFFGILVDNSYLTTLLSAKFEQDVITKEDVVRTGLKVYASQFKDYDPKHVNLSYPYILVNRSTWKSLVFKNDGETAFVGSYIELNRIMRYFANQHVLFRYHYLRDKALPKFGSLVVKIRSPFLEKVGTLAAKVMEFGVSGLVSYRAKEIPVTDVLINFEHFIGVNVILLVGLVVASVVFVVELNWNRCRRLILRLKPYKV